MRVRGIICVFDFLEMLVIEGVGFFISCSYYGIKFDVIVSFRCWIWLRCDYIWKICEKIKVK